MKLSLKKQSFTKFLSQVGLLLSGAGMFIYFFAIEYGMTPFLDRYFGIVSMILLLLSLAYIILECGVNVQKPSILVFAITAVALFRMIIGLISLSSSTNEQTVVSIGLGLIIYYSLIPVGILLLSAAENNRATLLGSNIFIFLLVVLNSPAGYFQLASGSDLATHQTFSFIIVFLCIIFTLTNGPLTSFALILIAMTSLFFIGARSEMLILIILFVVVCGFLVAKLRSLFILATVCTIFVLIGSIIPVDFKSIFVSFELNRILDLLENQAQSGSAIARAEINDQVLSQIRSAPILGHFAEYEPGRYAHNMLSVWVDFGILGFVLHILVFLVATYTILRADARLWDKSILLSALGGVFLLEAISKFYAYQLTALILGLIIGFTSKVRSATHLQEVK